MTTILILAMPLAVAALAVVYARHERRVLRDMQAELDARHPHPAE